MKIPTVEYCCGCIDLITAGKVLGWFGIVNGVFFCALLNTKGLDLTRHDLIVISFVLLGISSSWLYGIKCSRPKYLLVDVVLSAIFVVLLFAADIFLIGEAIVKSSNGIPVISRMGDLLIVYFCTTLLTSYFWIVMYSVYKAVKKLSEHPTSANHSDSRDEYNVTV